MINHFVAKGYAGAEYFCDRIQETAAIKKPAPEREQYCADFPKANRKNRLDLACF